MLFIIFGLNYELVMFKPVVNLYKLTVLMVLAIINSFIHVYFNFRFIF